MLNELQLGQLQMLCNFFNMRAGTHCWWNNEKTQQAAEIAFAAADGDVSKVKEHLRKRIDAGEKNFRDALQSFIDGGAVEAPQPVEPAAPQPQPAADQLTASMNFMGQVVMEFLAKTKLDEIRETVGNALREDVQAFISETYGPITRKITYELPERKVELDGIAHSKFETVLKFVQMGEPVFLTGPAGSGKNVICQQIAKALGLDFYFSNAVTQEYKLTGFTDAHGNFHESQFFKAFKYGGIFMLDEMDASIPEVLVILNAALANRYFDFPAPIGYVEAHKDFRIVAAGNTFGNGADYDYVGRNQLDAASLDRFAMVRIDYDPRIEEACANGDAQLVGFIRKFRAEIQRAGIRTVVSYRAISRMAKLSACMSKQEIIETCLIKSLDVDDLNAIRKELTGWGEWSTALNAIAAKK